MDSLTVSIIVPNFNHLEFLPRRMDSILSQTHERIELILLDDASSDGSVEFLRQYERYPKVKHLVINSENSGSPFMQWQRGIALAEGDFIWLAESDDYCEPNFLEELLRFNSEKNNTLDIIYSQSVDVDENGEEVANRIEYTENFEPNIWRDNFVLDGTTFIKKYLKEKCVIPNASAAIFRRSALGKPALSTDHQQMRICGDWFFWLKLARSGTVGFVSQPL
ncbi:MAG: glycosyltransferase, partial [Bacteroidota bacterium]